MTLNLATIPGDGTGPEVIDEALGVLNAVASCHGLDVTVTPYPFGAKHYLETGEVLTESDLDALRGHDAILLGAVGHPDVKPGVLERGLLLELRFRFDQYINLRPVRLYEGVQTPLRGKGPREIDLVVVRENTEDLYAGGGGVARRGTPQEVATQEMLATRFGVERCIRYAFDLARSRERKLLTLVHKTNVLTYAGDLWMRTFEEVGSEYGDIEREYHHIDAACMYLVTSPERYDTIVTANMFGDIITDLGAAIAGGMGIAASGNLNPDWKTNAAPGAAASAAVSSSPKKSSGGPSMFEPVHGSSPDIAGQNRANPLAAIDTIAMLLGEMGRSRRDDAMTAAGDAVNAAVRAVTPRFDGRRLDRSGFGTREIGQMVVGEVNK